MIPISELNLVKIGEIIKTHGYKGELIIKLTVDFENLNLTELIFAEIDGNKVPFFFSYPPKKHKKSGIRVKFDDINSDKDVKKLIETEVFTEAKNITQNKTSENSFIPENFNVFNRKTYIGKSAGILNIPSNPVLSVYTDENKEILIPVNDVFLKEINTDKKIIIFDLPDGLTEMNL